MSDVAVTWAKAQTVLGKDGKLDRNAKDALVYVASYANAFGYAFAAVPVLAFEMGVDIRQVQRGLAVVRCKPDEVAGFLEETGRWEIYQGKRYPVYRLRLETGPKNTAEALRANRLELLGVTPASPQAETAEGACGDIGVTPDPARGDTGVTPRGDTGATQIGNGTGKGEDKSSPAREGSREGGSDRFWAVFDAVGAAIPPQMRAITKWKLARKAYSRISRKLARMEALIAAAEAYGADPAVRARNVLPGLEVWLSEEMWKPYLPSDSDVVERAAEAVSAAPLLGGGDAPGWLIEAIEARGSPWAKSWLGEAVWDGDRGLIITRLGVQADRVNQDLGQVLRPQGVMAKSKSDAAAMAAPVGE